MAERIWEINIQGQAHKVRLEHGTISGRRKIGLDDRLIITDKHLVDYGSQHPFTIKEMTANPDSMSKS